MFTLCMTCMHTYMHMHERKPKHAVIKVRPATTEESMKRKVLDSCTNMGVSNYSSYVLKGPHSHRNNLFCLCSSHLAWDYMIIIVLGCGTCCYCVVRKYR